MIDSLRAHHEEIVGVIFAVVIIAAAWLEVFWPRRISDISRKPRWIANLALGAGNFALFALLPLGLYAAALMVEEQGWGLLHLLSMPWWLAIGRAWFR